MNDLETLAPFTPLYNASHLHNSFTPPPAEEGAPLISATQDLLNAMLANITVSAIPHFNAVWTTRADVTTETTINIYAFSRPANVILPYTLALALALPCLALGLLALRANGVPAVDGGFVQLLATTRGTSETVDRLAAGACLGGEHNVPRALKRLRLRYGELLVGGSSTPPLDLGLESGEHARGGQRGACAVRRRAGFGTDGEVGPLL
jgi:hypothetical protein